jgi:hypothetical protein
MAIDTIIPRTRRALLAGGIGGLAALVASALGRPLPAEAGSDGDVVLGADNPASTRTSIFNTTNGETPFEGMSYLGDGLRGTTKAGTRAGVRGVSDIAEAYGVCGENPTTGAFGSLAGLTGVEGDSAGGTGVLGYSGSETAPTAPLRTGVYGQATQDANARGVHGYSTSGRGVFGQATSGYGVRGYATSGTAIYAASADPKTGYALRAVGRVRFDKCAGVAIVQENRNAVSVEPGVDLTSTSAVVATLQGGAGSPTTTVSRVIVNATTNTFTIYLTANTYHDVRVAWHVFG